MIEATYDNNAAELKNKRENEAEKKNQRHCIKLFGYSHPKSNKFLAYFLRSLKDCLDLKTDQLNVNMNQFLLVKNELSLSFLRNMDNIVATLKTAVKLYAQSDQGGNRKELE